MEGENLLCFLCICGTGQYLLQKFNDGIPIPSFAGEPERGRLMGDIDTFTGMVWNSLNEDNKVSLFVRYIDLATGKTQELCLRDRCSENF